MPPRNDQSNFHSVKNELTHYGKKMIKISCQYQYLKKCRELLCLPIGIYSQSKFSISFQHPDTQQICTDIFLDAASRVFDVLINHYSTWSKNLATNYFKKKDDHSSSFPSEVYKQICDNVSHDIGVEKAQQNTRLEKKLANDKRERLNSYKPPTKTQTNTLTHHKSSRKNRHPKKIKLKRSRQPSQRHKRASIKAPIQPSASTAPTEDVEKCYVNLSDKVLTEDHKSLFFKSPSFSPVPRSVNYK